MKQGREKTESAAIEAGTWKRVLKCEGEPALTLTLRQPKLPEDRPPFRRIGRYYQRMAGQWRERWENLLFQRACSALAEARKRSVPFRPWEAALDYTLTYNQAGLLSLYTDAWEYTGGAHGVTVRCGDVWDLNAGVPLPLRSFFPSGNRWRRAALEAARAQVERQLSTGEALYFDDWPQSLADGFDPCRFYLTEEGIVVFYPLYTLAPYAQGFPTLLVKNWEEAC